MFDLKIVNGQIVDGSGRTGYLADVGISGDRITAVGNLAAAPARETINAAGKIVAPGFIDMHTHSDLSVLYDPHANSKIYDGVTTEVVGNCGIGVALRDIEPLRRPQRQHAAAFGQRLLRHQHAAHVGVDDDRVRLPLRRTRA